MTFFAARYDRKTRELTYSNAGHNFPYYCNSNKLKEILGGNEFTRKEMRKMRKKNFISNLLSTNMRLGFKYDSDFLEETITLQPDDVLLFYTDGIIEAVNKNQEQYGKSRFVRKFIEHIEKPAPLIRQEIINDVYNYIDNTPLEDDITLVAVRIK